MSKFLIGNLLYNLLFFNQALCVGWSDIIRLDEEKPVRKTVLELGGRNEGGKKWFD